MQGSAHALSRLAHRFGESQPNAAPNTAPTPRFAAQHSHLGPDSHPFADLARLAALLAGGTVPADDPAFAQAPAPGPAAVALEASKHGLDAVCEARAIASLQPSDAPLVVLLAGGGSRLVIAVDQEEGDPFAVLATSIGEVRVDLPALAAVSNGSVFRLRMRAPVETGVEEGLASQQSPRALRPHVGTNEVQGSDIAGLLIHALRERKPLIIQLVIATAIINLCGLALPLFSMAVFDRVIPHAAMETLFALALGVGLALVLELALRHARLKLFDAVGQSTALSMQGRLVGRLLFARTSDIPRSPGAMMHPV
ncbi:MAG: hypothetical protein ACRCWO_01015, partial [Bosea sp. (in: a-proteobacteria)]